MSTALLLSLVLLQPVQEPAKPLLTQAVTHATATLTPTAHPDEHHHDGLIWQAGVVLFAAVNGADLGLTAQCLGAKRCKEANPLYRWAAGRPGMLGAVKLTVAAIEALWLKKIHRTRPKLAKFVLYGTSAILGGVVIFNARQLDKAGLR